MSPEFNIPKEQQSRFDSQRSIENRQIRIFLSSTFSDMQEERDALIKTFNSLKVEANKRNVNLSVVDLRWGVTDEEARTGKVISVCLNEIEHSHPFFIGMLGSRYGYAPDLSELRKNPDLKERYPWIEKAIEEKLSITEMEILYGALCNDDVIDAVFYFRKSDIPDDSPKLTALKEKIIQQQRFPHDEYASVDELCEKVDMAVMQMLDEHFPVTETTPLDRERTAQQAFINSRHGQYLRRQSDFDYINHFIASDDPCLVVTGQSGMGKSALLANWIKENTNNGNYHLVYHFVGNSLSASNSYANILRHLCDEIYDLYGLKRDTEGKRIEDEAKNAFMGVYGQDKPLVIVIDGIDQVLEISNEKQLTWLPDPHSNLKYIFTTLPNDETMEVFQRRGYKILTLQPMSLEARRQFAICYLENVGKHLTDAQWKRIMDDKENENTLVLKTLLDELICFGTHEEIDKRIDYYLNAPSVPEFYDRMLQRMENDYSNGQDLVRHTLSLIALSEKGLSEDELMAITGYRKIDWNLFYCAIYNHLVDKGGLITFSHQNIMNAVEQRYIQDQDVDSLRDEIIGYFEKNDLEGHYSQTTKRTVSELTYQYYTKEDWDRLYKSLMNLYAFRSLHEDNEYLLAAYWRALKRVDRGKYTLAGYLDLEYSNMDGAAYLHEMAKFICDYFDSEDHDLISKLVYKALEHNPNDNDSAMLHNLLSICDKPHAVDHFLKAVEFAEKAHNDKILAGTYLNLGAYYGTLKIRDHSLKVRLKSASSLMEKAENYIRKGLDLTIKSYGPDHPRVAIAYLNLAGAVYLPLKEYAKALECLKKTMEIQLRTLGEHTHYLRFTYMYLAVSYAGVGQYEEGLKYFDKSYQQIAEFHGEDHPDTQKAKMQLERFKTGIMELMKQQQQGDEIAQKELRNMHISW